ncbi:hypothetical protein ACB092_12G217500 [Castanea dentata]
MKCGGRLIFQQEIEDLNQPMQSGDDCDGTSGECTSFNKAHCINHFKALFCYMLQSKSAYILRSLAPPYQDHLLGLLQLALHVSLLEFF